MCHCNETCQREDSQFVSDEELDRRKQTESDKKYNEDYMKQLMEIFEFANRVIKW